MPVVQFTLRWPDGTVQHCESPSRAIERALAPGASYPVDELLRRTDAALHEGSERVRAKYGFACTESATQRQALHRGAGRHARPLGRVLVESVQRVAPAPTHPPPKVVDGHVAVVVIGAGQAGLCVSWELVQRGIDHVVLEGDRIAHAWKSDRWDAFCLVTPNWQCQLPGLPYDGDDPDGFMLRDEVVSYVERFASSFEAPVYEGVAVGRVAEGRGGDFVLETSHGTLSAGQVVLAVGGYHRPRFPALAEQVPAVASSVHSSAYRNPTSLPDGAVLVVGTGQSGAQIAEDLHLAGREVHLSVGSAPRVARRWRGRDVVAWLHDIGHYELPIDEHPEGLGARKEPNHYVTGRDGGHDLDLRTFATQGMHLHGRLAGMGPDGHVRFAADLRANLDGADETYDRINDTIDKWIAERGIDAPAGTTHSVAWEPDAADGGGELDLEDAGISSIVWATGYESDWDWVAVDGLLDETGYPAHARGVTEVPGLHMIGLPWLHTWGSGRFAAVARDAKHLSGHIAAAARVAEAA